MSAAPRPSAATLQSGMRIDRYEVIELLGAGGFGAVYRARHAHTHQIVAMKVLRTGARENATAWEALLREAKAMASIGHPNILRVYDAGVSEQGTPFLVMEFVEGADLGKLLQTEGRALAPERAVAIMLQVLGALGAAHARGVVHRDVKPANIIVRPVRDAQGATREQAMLLDFGISKLRDSEYARTQPGLAMGTPGFMAPEQIENAASADARSDVYAAGVTLYLLLAGRLPFDGTNPQELISNMLLGATVPLRRTAPHVPSSLATVVDHAISRDPALRWPDASSFAAALESSMTQSKRDVAVANAATVALDPNALGTGPTTVKNVEELGNARTVAVPSSRPPPMFGSAPTPVVSIPPPPLVPAGFGASFSSGTPAPAAVQSTAHPASAALLPPADAAPRKSRRKLVIAAGATAVVLCGAIAGASALGAFDDVEGGSESDKTRVATAPVPAAAPSGVQTVPPAVVAPNYGAPPNPVPMPSVPAVPVPSPATADPSVAQTAPAPPSSIEGAAAQAILNNMAQQYGIPMPTGGGRNYVGGFHPVATALADDHFTVELLGPAPSFSADEISTIAHRAAPAMARCAHVPSPIALDVMVTPGMVMLGSMTGHDDAEAQCLLAAFREGAAPTLANHSPGTSFVRIRRR